MSRTPDNNSRRRFLRLSAEVGMLAGFLGLAPKAVAAGKADMPAGDPNSKNSIRMMRGQVFVNGRQATKDTVIGTTAEVRTGPRSTVAFVVGQDAHLLKSNTSVKLAGSGSLTEQMRLLSGKLLSVWGERPAGKQTQLVTTTATMGIRGTVTYSEPDVFTLLEGSVDYTYTDASGNRQTVNLKNEDGEWVTYDKHGNKTDRPPQITEEDLAFVTLIVGYKKAISTSRLPVVLDIDRDGVDDRTDNTFIVPGSGSGSGTGGGGGTDGSSPD